MLKLVKYNHINESNKKLTEESTKKSLANEISRRLLQLEFEENHSVKSKCLKFIIKKYIAHNIKQANLFQL